MCIIITLIGLPYLLHQQRCMNYFNFSLQINKYTHDIWIIIRDLISSSHPRSFYTRFISNICSEDKIMKTEKLTLSIFSAWKQLSLFLCIQLIFFCVVSTIVPIGCPKLMGPKWLSMSVRTCRCPLGFLALCSAHSFFCVFSGTLIQVLQCRHFADEIKAPGQLTLK